MKSSYFLSNTPPVLAAAGLRAGANVGMAGAALGAETLGAPTWGAAEGAAEKLAFLGLATAPASRLTLSDAGTMQVTVLSCSARGILTTVEAAWTVGLTSLCSTAGAWVS